MGAGPARAPVRPSALPPPARRRDRTGRSGRRGRRRGLRSGGDEPTAEERLERARAVISDAGSFRLSSTIEEESVTGEVGGAGSQSSYRTTIAGEMARDDFRVTSDVGDWADEVVSVAGEVYTRSATGLDSLADEPWVIIPADQRVGSGPALGGGALTEEFLAFSGLDMDADGQVDADVAADEALLESLVVPTLARYDVWGLGAPPGSGGSPVALPSAFAEAFGTFDDAEVAASSAGTTTIRAVRPAPAALSSLVDIPLPDGRFEVVLDGDDLPTALRLDVTGDTATYREEVSFSDWGADITVDVPEGEVDDTPWVDEDEVAAVRTTVDALAPTALPDGLELAGIDALSADDAELTGAGPCGQLYLTFAPPLTSDATADEWFSSPDYLDVYLLPVDCARTFDDTPFEPGGLGDVPSRDSCGLTEVLVGRTVVQFDTTYVVDEALVASIRPFDLDAELARTGELSEQMWNDPPGM